MACTCLHVHPASRNQIDGALGSCACRLNVCLYHTCLVCAHVVCFARAWLVCCTYVCMCFLACVHMCCAVLGWTCCSACGHDAKAVPRCIAHCMRVPVCLVAQVLEVSGLGCVRCLRMGNP